MTPPTPISGGRREPHSAPPGRRSGAARWLPAAVAVALLAAVGFLIWYFLFRSSDGEPAAQETRDDISVTASALDFGDEDLGKRSATQTVTLMNGTPAPLGIAEIAVEGENARDFVVAKATTCSTEAPLNEDESCSLVARFRPRGRGARSAELVVRFNGDRGERSVALRGSGVGEPAVVIETTRLDFGTGELEAKPEVLRVALTNVGNAPLRIHEIAIDGAASGDFKIVGGNKTCSASRRVRPRTSCAVAVRFAPSELGNRQATLVIDHDAEGGPARIELRGVGAGTPRIALVPDPVDFGGVRVASRSKPKTLTVTNSGTDVLEVSTVRIDAGDEDDFQIVAGGTCSRGEEVAPGASCTVSVRFRPTRAGNRAATLTIASNAADGPGDVRLRGTGTRARAARAGTGEATP